MHYPPVDYTPEEVRNVVVVLEQYSPHVKNRDVEDAIVKAIAMIRAIDKIGKGTEWLSKMSGT